MGMTADQVREKVWAILRQRMAKGETVVAIKAGEIDYINLPNVCQAMSGKKIERHQDEFAVEIIRKWDERNGGYNEGSKARPSTTFFVEYKITSTDGARISPETIETDANAQSKAVTDKPVPHQSASQTEVTLEPLSILEAKEKLDKLKELRKDEYIDDEAYTAQVKEILDRL